MDDETAHDKKRLDLEAFRVMGELHKQDRHKHDHYVGSFCEGFRQGYAFAQRELTEKRSRRSRRTAETKRGTR